MMAAEKRSYHMTIGANLIGAYVIVRCRDAGVHAGFLVEREGRECTLKDARRLWYWKCAKGDFLNGVALNGLHHTSKIGAALPLIILTENCEIILCSETARDSIMGIKNHGE